VFVKERQLRACLETLGYEGPYGMPYDGASPSDEWLVDHLMRRRDFDDEGKCLILQSWLERVVNVPPECDSEYRQPVSSPSLAEERDQEDALLSQDSKYTEDADSQELRDLQKPASSQGSAASPTAASSSPAASVAAAASSPPAAVAAAASSKHGYKTRPVGRPAMKAAAGMEAREVAKQSERLRHDNKDEPADALMAERVQMEGGPSISPEYAARQAKELAEHLYSSAGGLANAAAVYGKLVKLQEIRCLPSVQGEPYINERIVGNLVEFTCEQLSTKGTRHAEDQNAHDVILTAAVDGRMDKDRLIRTVSKLFGVPWAAVKRAVLRRVKLNDEKIARTETWGASEDRSVGGRLWGGVWQRVLRSIRCDKYDLPGFVAFMHDEEIFRFSSRHSEPLRKHEDVGKYSVHPSLCTAPPQLTLLIWQTRSIPNMSSPQLTLLIWQIHSVPNMARTPSLLM
jgi:hypothetical protein